MHKWTLSACLCVVSLLASPAFAQPIHKQPQKAVYASPAEYPWLSDQCHYNAPGVNPLYGTGIPDATSSHVHLDLQCPEDAELGLTPFDCNFSVTLRQVAGEIGFIWGNIIPVTALRFDNPALSFPLRGDPVGIVTATGSLTMDPSSADPTRLAAHGWKDTASVNARTFYDNGAVMNNQLIWPAYSVVDVSQPEVGLGDGSGTPSQQARCDVYSANPAIADEFGVNATEIKQMIPLLGPVTPGLDWKMNPLTYGYGQKAGLPLGTFRLRLDPDLHHGIPGTFIDVVTGQGGTNTIEALPGDIPAGAHKLMFQWEQASHDGTEMLTSNLVVSVTVGPGGVAQPPDQVPGAIPTTPTTCTDPKALNVGGPLPCVFPTPALLCSGTITGTSADGTTIAVTGGVVTCK